MCCRSRNQGWISYIWTRVLLFYVCPQNLVWSSQDKHMSVLNFGRFTWEYHLDLFHMFGRQVVSSVLKCGLFQNFCLSLDTCGLFQSAKRDTPPNALTFQLSSEDQYWFYSINLTDILAITLFRHVVLKRLLFGHFELPKQQFCWPS